MGASYQIVNIVGKATLEKEIDFLSCLKEFPLEVNFGPNYYGGRFAHFKFTGMTGRVAVWHSGKMMGLGTKSTEQAFHELRIVAGKLNCGFKLQPVISNIVSVFDIGSSIDLESFIEKALAANIRSIYEPEQFPGATFRIEKPFEASILIFASGKVILPGFKNVEQIQVVIEKIKDLLVD
jgi:TATA-box binding protein (TBP) (component of TFIID and TFIIIB)